MHGKMIAIAAGAVGYGALVSWAITADYYERKLALKDEYIEELRRRPIGRLLSIIENDRGITADAVLFDDAEKSPEETSDGESVTDEKEGEDESSEVDEAQTEAIRSNLQQIIDTYTADPDTQTEFIDRAVRSEVDRTPPFVISREMFSWDEEGEEYEKTTITYYPAQRILIDEEEEVIEDVANVIGWKNLNRFGDESGSADVVFVRNRRLRTDYEVVRDEDNPLPLHVKYGMPREEFNVTKAAGLIRLRDEDK